MGTSTPAPLTLYKPDDTELVDVEVHLGDNYDKINDWAILKDAAEYKFLGGLQRTNDSASIDDDPEVIICSSGTVSLPASSLIIVRTVVNFRVSGTAGQDWIFRNKIDNLAGANVKQAVERGNSVAVDLAFEHSFMYKTTTAESKFWVATIQRLGGTDGGFVAKAGTSVTAWRAGPSSLLGDFV